MAKQNNNSKLRARTYSRTSGEGQRDNTSIPTQKEGSEKFIGSNAGWVCTGHYVDECKSGANVAGRDGYQKAIKDLMNDEYDILVPFDISRFGRDGLDIIRDSEMLKRNFGKYVVDSKGQFDNRDHHKVMTNFIFAGIAEDERLRILERTTRGRIRKAEQGKPWSRTFPIGRAYDEKKGWHLTEKGKQLRKLYPRYADGESVKPLAKEFGIKSTQKIAGYVRESQLSGTYYAKFHSPEIGIDIQIPIPNMPEVISPELEKRVRDRMDLNRKWNKLNTKEHRKYNLTGFAYCSHCGKSLNGQTKTDGSNFYYRHSNYLSDEKNICPYHGINGAVLESSVFEYLYSFFLDKPAFEQAVKNALPDVSDRQAIEEDIAIAKKQLNKLDKEELKLVEFFDEGIKKTSVLIEKQNKIIERRQVVENRLDELNETLAAMANTEAIKQHAGLLRYKLLSQHWGRDWRQIPYDDIRKFLHFLFGDNPSKQGYGIFVGKQNDQWHITFKGRVEFYHDVIDGQPEFPSHLTRGEINRLTAKLEERKTLTVLTNQWKN